MSEEKKLSHLDSSGNPRMVNVGEKQTSQRQAHAQALVQLPPEVLDLLVDQELYTKKGGVFQTAIIAGTMAAKRTSDLIPLCHPIGMDSCKITVQLNEKRELVIDCHTQVTAKTGVEMEALTGASVAALTVYDMCKGMSQNIIIREIKLMAKTGGKTDFKRQTDA